MKKETASGIYQCLTKQIKWKTLYFRETCVFHEIITVIKNTSVCSVKLLPYY